MMTRKTRLLVIGIILLVLILLVIWFFLVSRLKNSISSDTQGKSAQITQQIEIIIPSVEEQQMEQEQQERTQSAGVVSVAKMFVERYGSYSNEALFQNLKDVLQLMTDTFAQQTQNVIDQSTPQETYFGVTTRVLTVKVEEMNEEESARILINTQREISEGSTQNISVSYQQIRVQLVKMDGIWKIDFAEWL